jgi:hypothetical protein
MPARKALADAIEALESIALAGMSGSGQESEDALRDWHARQAWSFIGIAARALGPARQALAACAEESASIALPSVAACWCTTCRPITLEDMRFVVCPDCGNKRCPKATDHELACTSSNEAGQAGSRFSSSTAGLPHQGTLEAPFPRPDGAAQNR